MSKTNCLQIKRNRRLSSLFMITSCCDGRSVNAVDEIVHQHPEGGKMKRFTQGVLILALAAPGVCSAKAFKGKFKCNGTAQTTSNGITLTEPVKAAKMLSEIIPAGGLKQSLFTIDLAPLVDGLMGFVSEEKHFSGSLLYEQMKTMRMALCGLPCSIYGYRSTITGTSNATGSQVKLNISESWSQQKSGQPSESRSNNYTLTCKK